MVKFKHTGDFEKTFKFLKRNRVERIRSILDNYGKRGVEALSKATPVDTGKTAASWGYTLNISDKSIEIDWTNDNFNDGVPVALVIQYGHAMPNGGFVTGIDYINPAMKPIFDEIVNDIWKEVV